MLPTQNVKLFTFIRLDNFKIDTRHMDEIEFNLMADPLGFDIYESIETFESIMSSLAGIYFQLWFREQKKPLSLQNIANAHQYRKRHSEILKLKRTYPITAMAERQKAINVYSFELRSARARLTQS